MLRPFTEVTLWADLPVLVQFWTSFLPRLDTLACWVAASTLRGVVQRVSDLQYALHQYAEVLTITAEAKVAVGALVSSVGALLPRLMDTAASLVDRSSADKVVLLAVQLLALAHARFHPLVASQQLRHFASLRRCLHALYLDAHAGSSSLLPPSGLPSASNAGRSPAHAASIEQQLLRAIRRELPCLAACLEPSSRPILLQWVLLQLAIPVEAACMPHLLEALHGCLQSPLPPPPPLQPPSSPLPPTSAQAPSVAMSSGSSGSSRRLFADCRIDDRSGTSARADEAAGKAAGEIGADDIPAAAPTAVGPSALAAGSVMPDQVICHLAQLLLGPAVSTHVLKLALRGCRLAWTLAEGAGPGGAEDALKQLVQALALFLHGHGNASPLPSGGRDVPGELQRLIGERAAVRESGDGSTVATTKAIDVRAPHIELSAIGTAPHANDAHREPGDPDEGGELAETVQVADGGDGDDDDASDGSDWDDWDDDEEEEEGGAEASTRLQEVGQFAWWLVEATADGQRMLMGAVERVSPADGAQLLSALRHTLTVLHCADSL